MASHRQDATLRTLFERGTTVGLTDGDLLDRFTAKDQPGAELAFRALVERHGPHVLRVCRQILGNSADADDAFQATFLILARKAGSIRQGSSLAAWLHGVAAHVATSARSSASRRRRHETQAGAHRPQTTPEPPADDLRAVVFEELSRLPERYRTAVVLCCLQGLTQQEAAHEAGWPLGTLQSRLARGRDRLRDRLTRRGYAPSVALAATHPVAGLAVSVPLVQSTTRVALTALAGRSLAIGAVPVAVQTLAQGDLRAMYLIRLKSLGLILGLAGALSTTVAVAWTFQHEPVAPANPITPNPTPLTAQLDPTDDRLTIRGVVVAPPGVRFEDMVVSAVTEQDFGSSPTTRPDQTGRFELRGQFVGWARLHARTNDGRWQAILPIAEDTARTTLSQPVELRLTPATPHPVLVRAEGQPVAGATIMAVGTTLTVTGTTGHDGAARLFWPSSSEPLQSVVAWHPDRGANSFTISTPLAPSSTILVDLHPSQPQMIRAVNLAGGGVAGLELAFNFLPQGGTRENDWITTRDIPAAHLRTDPSGTVVIPWAPRPPLQFIEVVVTSPGWKIDQIDRDQLAEGVTTVHVRPEHAVQGRLVMPEGASAAGILVTGFGFGPHKEGDIPLARARADGRFTLQVPAAHGFALGVVDSAWASDPWTGPILNSDADDATPAEITIPVYPATPLTVRVTRGPDRRPVAGASVQVDASTDFIWLDPSGTQQSAQGGPGFWTRTDATGVAHAGVGRGKMTVLLNDGTWSEERAIEVVSDQARTVEFHRPWIGQRRVAGRLLDGGIPCPPAPSLAVHAWATQKHRPSQVIKPVVAPDGSFVIERDAETFRVLAFDPTHRRSAFAQVGPETATVDLPLEPTASYGGTLVDENGKPLPDRKISLGIQEIRPDPIATVRTDEHGCFRFPSVPARAALELNLQDAGTPPQDWTPYLIDRDRFFEPGEVRLDQTLQAGWIYAGPISPPPSHSGATAAAVAAKLPPLSASLELIGGNARVSGMQALAVILSNDSPVVASLVEQLLDDEQDPPILSYLPTRLNAGRVQAEAATMDRLGWPRPEAGEVALVTLDHAGQPLASTRLSSADPAAAIEQGKRFLQEHRPAPHDARATVAEGRAEAKRTGRKVWVIVGGPRCGPCFRLARWVEAHRSTLELDYVVVKVMEGLDDHADEVVDSLPIQPGEGIPWHVITASDGSILATSVGPLGNIGLPSSVEGLRHFHAMLDKTRQRITPAEVDGLVESLREAEPSP